MEVNGFVWAVTIAVIAGFFIFDFFSHVRTPHEPSIKESAGWSLFYIALACLFGLFLWVTWGEPGNPHQHGIEFFTGYVTEKALSIDNLFVFALIMTSFKVPRKYQQKVLLIGIAIALLLRLIFILAGAAVIELWSDVFYIFGAFLLWTAGKLLWDEISDKEETDPNDMFVVRMIRKVVPVHDDYHGDKLSFKKNGKRVLTPLFVALLAIGFVDVLFALDSIPAIYGITQEPYVVFTTNAFALLGLRQLYFLLDGLLDKLVYLSYGLSLILAFIGVKLLLHALHENKLPFINGGENVKVFEVPVELSLVVILGILLLTTFLSLTVGNRLEEEKNAQEWPVGRDKDMQENTEQGNAQSTTVNGARADASVE